jgi:predicted nuclease of predicted toxin-antitoxin system
MLITADKDFGEIVFRQGRSSGGVILIRLQGLSPEAKAEAVSKAINEHPSELPGNFSVLSPGALRIRRRFV